jgi:hypothetical protein
MMKLVLRTHFLNSSYFGRTSGKGKAPFVYTLSSQSQKYLKDLGIDVDLRFRPEEEILRSNQHLLHTLAINDFLISAKLLTKAVPAISLAEMRHERILKREPDRVSVVRADGATELVSVIPDSWLDIRVQPPGQERPSQYCVALERDRGTTEQKAFRQRIRARVAWRQEAYQKHFGTRSLTIAYVVSPPGKRLDDVRAWTEAELDSLGKKFSEPILFTDIDPATSSPEELFLSRLWYEPFRRNPVALIDDFDQK